MKKMRKYRLENENEMVTVYEEQDLEKFKHYFNYAREAWYREWVRLGSQEKGSSCGGKGIRIRYRGPRKRTWEYLKVVSSPPCQGNISAYASVGPALEYMKACEIEADYDDGWCN